MTDTTPNTCPCADCHVLRLKARIEEPETEVRNLRGYGDDPSKGPVYVSIFQHQEALRTQAAMYQRWATTGTMLPGDVPS